MVTILICYQIGTPEILRTTLGSIARHTKDSDYKIVIAFIGEQNDFDCEYEDIATLSNVILRPLTLDEPEAMTRTHGAMIDKVVPDIDTELLLTLDSDCFPIASGWLEDLIKMIQNGAGCSGILHPWSPPPKDMLKSKIEYRVRSQHCWETTHVACQLINVDFLKSLNTTFKDGDDTGLLIPMAIKKIGKKIEGFKPSRCPMPEGNFDAEFNRYTCIVFGDKMFHLGGYTRENAFDDDAVLDGFFNWAKNRIAKEDGAEFLLDDDLSHTFIFDKEAEVAKEKMQRLFGLSSQRMEG